MRLAYVNGRYVPLRHAAVGVEDRGLQFADAVYEVAAAFNGRLLDWDKHLARLRRGLAALFIEGVMADAALTHVAHRLLRLNAQPDALLYIQATRGEAPRNHVFPAAPTPNLMMTVRRFDWAARVRDQRQGVACAVLPDQRWARRDIKSTSLLPNVLAKEEARRLGCAEAVLIEDGLVTEGSSANIWIVDASGTLVTRGLGPHLLPGVMRDTLLALARAAGLAVVERAFTEAELRAAREAFLTSTSSPVIPITRLDGAPLADGAPGPITTRCAALMWAEITRQTGHRPA